MIVCVAGNPSVDKLFLVDRLTAGRIHRPSAFVQVPGGKGLNVARAATALGDPVVAVGVLGGHSGRWVAEALEGEGIPGRFAWTPGETRACLSVADRETNSLTEFYESGPQVTEDAWRELEDLVAGLLPETTWITMSGSLPAGAPATGYARLVTLAREAGVPAAIDSHGGALDAALDAGPGVVKVNAAEAADLLGGSVGTEAEAVRAAAMIRARAGGGDHVALVTRGIDGAVVVGPDGSAWAGSLSVEGPYPVGSGDAFLAGLIVALGRGEDWPEALAVALGAGAANAEAPGAGRLDGARAATLALQATIRRLPRPSGIP